MATENLLFENPVILFDGMCNLCSSSVQFVIKRDKKNLFRFASLQSMYGQSILQKFNLPPAQLNSFILYKNGNIFTQSTGALLVAKELYGGWKLLSVCLIVPKSIRDFIYNFISNHRYKWFGKKKECWLPTPELRKLFVDN